MDDVCSAYEELEEKMKCGETGYLLNFGVRNCREFSKPETRAIFSPVGNSFLDCTRSCLMRSLAEFERNPSTTCASVLKDGFDSHTDCYLACDFCKISKDDIAALIKNYNPADFLSLRALKQVVEVASSCD